MLVHHDQSARNFYRYLYSNTVDHTHKVTKMSYDKDFQNWIKDVMPKVIENLGLDINKVRYKICESTEKIMSIIYYVVLQVENETTEQNEEFSVILKKPMQKLMHHVDSQFHNEILFYQMYTQPEENYARCIYINERPPTNSVIALENVNKRGYHPCSYKYNVPLEYILAAMREIGRFHGKGYAMKKLQQKFFDIVMRLLEARYFKTMENAYECLCNLYSTQIVEYLRNHGHAAVFCDKIEALLSNAFDEVMMKTVEPLEPLSTLCHGDFILDNMLFKTEDDGQQRVMLIDFALLRYSTPVIDLSTYLCLCCSNEIIKYRFFEIMRAYHDALKEYLVEAGVWDMEKYSYEVLLDDYRRGGLFGFVIASFYLPVLLGYCNPEKFKQIDTLKGIKQVKLDNEMCKILVDIVTDSKRSWLLEKYFIIVSFKSTDYFST